MQVTSGKVKLRLSEKIHRCLFLVALVSELKLSDGLIQINPLQPMSYIILCFNKVHSRKISEVSQTQDRTSNFKIPHRLTLHPVRVSSLINLQMIPATLQQCAQVKNQCKTKSLTENLNINSILKKKPNFKIQFSQDLLKSMSKPQIISCSQN